MMLYIVSVVSHTYLLWLLYVLERHQGNDHVGWASYGQPTECGSQTVTPMNILRNIITESLDGDKSPGGQYIKSL